MPKARTQEEAEKREKRDTTPIFDTPEEFEKAANRYFADCDATGELYGEAGLLLALRKYNKKKRVVLRDTLRSWAQGHSRECLQEVAQVAYMRITYQIETDPRYQEKHMISLRIFLQKQPWFGGYQDRIEQKQVPTVKIVFGEGMEESDFK